MSTTPGAIPHFFITHPFSRLQRYRSQPASDAETKTYAVDDCENLAILPGARGKRYALRIATDRHAPLITTQDWRFVISLLTYFDDMAWSAMSLTGLSINAISTRASQGGWNRAGRQIALARTALFTFAGIRVTKLELKPGQGLDDVLPELRGATGLVDQHALRLVPPPGPEAMIAPEMAVIPFVATDSASLTAATSPSENTGEMYSVCDLTWHENRLVRVKLTEQLLRDARGRPDPRAVWLDPGLYFSLESEAAARMYEVIALHVITGGDARSFTIPLQTVRTLMGVAPKLREDRFRNQINSALDVLKGAGVLRTYGLISDGAGGWVLWVQGGPPLIAARVLRDVPLTTPLEHRALVGLLLSLGIGLEKAHKLTERNEVLLRDILVFVLWRTNWVAQANSAAGPNIDKPASYVTHCVENDINPTNTAFREWRAKVEAELIRDMPLPVQPKASKPRGGSVGDMSITLETGRVRVTIAPRSQKAEAVWRSLQIRLPEFSSELPMSTSRSMMEMLEYLAPYDIEGGTLIVAAALGPVAIDAAEPAIAAVLNATVAKVSDGTVTAVDVIDQAILLARASEVSA